MGTGMEVIQQRWSHMEYRQHPASKLHEKTIWKPAQEPSVPVNTATHRPQLVIHGREDLSLPRRRVAQETVTLLLVACPYLREIRMKLRSEVGDAFSSASTLPAGSAGGKRGNPDTFARAKTVTYVRGIYPFNPDLVIKPLSNREGCEFVPLRGFDVIDSADARGVTQAPGAALTVTTSTFF